MKLIEYEEVRGKPILRDHIHFFAHYGNEHLSSPVHSLPKIRVQQDGDIYFTIILLTLLLLYLVKRLLTSLLCPAPAPAKPVKEKKQPIK